MAEQAQNEQKQTQQPQASQVQGAPKTKPYRLIGDGSGKAVVHYIPNPNFKEGDPPGSSHHQAKEGDVIQLTEEQFKSFRHKFRPVSDGDAVQQVNTKQS